MTATRTFAEGDRVALDVDPANYGRRTLLGTVNLPYRRDDGSPGRTIEVILDDPVVTDAGTVRAIYTTAERLRPVAASAVFELPEPKLSSPTDFLAWGYVVVSTELEPNVLLGNYVRTEEDAVIYIDSTGTRHVAPVDCVDVIPRRELISRGTVGGRCV